MRLTCHRCGGDLPGDDLRGFCPTCGAPQLRFGSEAAGESDGAESTGTMPPPRPQEIQWPLATRCAAVVAAGSAAVFALTFALPGLSLPSLLLLLSASFLTVALYRRRAPASVMTAGVGARLGLSTGVLLTAGLAVVLSAMLLVARFRTHSMGAFDAQWNAQVHDLFERTKATSPMPAEAEQQMRSPEFRAGSMLGGLLLLGGFLVVVSAGSGAFAASIAVRGRAKL